MAGTPLAPVISETTTGTPAPMVVVTCTGSAAASGLTMERVAVIIPVAELHVGTIDANGFRQSTVTGGVVTFTRRPPKGHGHRVALVHIAAQVANHHRGTEVDHMEDRFHVAGAGRTDVRGPGGRGARRPH